MSHRTINNHYLLLWVSIIVSVLGLPNKIFALASATCDSSRDVDTPNDNNADDTTGNQHECQNTVTTTTTSKSTKLPHILFIILDDLGSNDLGLHNSGIQTPYIDQLATTEGGIYLSNYYVLPYCSPTRAAILSGRYPLHTGLHTIITEDSTDGLPLDEETLPTVLRRVGYSAHAVGKWHVGHSKWEQTPTYRGFESFYGYYLGRSDYYTHYKDSEVYGVDGYDLRYDRTEFCGPKCSTLVDERGNYSTHIFTREAIRIINDHKATKGDEQPLFLYLAHQAVHSPNEVPTEYSDTYANQTDWNDLRKLYAGMLTAADESIGNVTRALQDAGMWNNTLVIFTTDNGGPTGACSMQGSSNGIRRGGKCTVWDGGTLGDAFLSGPALQTILQQQQRPSSSDEQSSEQTTVNKRNGIKYPYLYHAVDWLPTLAEIVGATPNGKPLDGISHLQALKALVQDDDRKDATTTEFIPPREELFVGYASIKNKWYGPAVRYKNWKLIQGISGGPQTATDNPDGPIDPAPGGIINTTYLLFDINTDPEEANDISADYPIVVQILQAKLRDYQESYVPPISHDSTCDPFAGLINTSLFGPAWMPWCSKVIVYS